MFFMPFMVNFLSFIVPAHDEEALIGRALEAIRSSASGAGVAFEIIVVDDGSTDRTAEIASAAGSHVVRVDVRQIGAARNAGAAVATGEILIFVDADTFIAPAHVRGVVDAIARGAVGGGAATRFDDPAPRWAHAGMHLWVWISRTFRVAAGSFLFCRADAFRATGGFDPALYASEEIALSRALKRLQRGPFVILREPVLTSGRKARTHTGGEIARTWFGLVLRPWSVRRRDRLAMWYGPRRRDR
jgi:glycosyltransferase involved in cell wall biosynthesis